ncbi:cation diffusion facilitator family transporter, partial [Staphylococcus capitis]
LIINVIIAGMMFAGSDTEHNLNMRGAFLHVIGDLLGSIGALIAAVLIWLFGWNLADPIVSILMSLIILKGAWGVLKSSLNILMEGTPE